jgi:hypothetical protein
LPQLSQAALGAHTLPKVVDAQQPLAHCELLLHASAQTAPSPVFTQ